LKDDVSKSKVHTHIFKLLICDESLALLTFKVLALVTVSIYDVLL